MIRGSGWAMASQPPIERPNARSWHRNQLRRDRGRRLRHGAPGLRAHALFSQIALHAEYGGVVPELASRDHVRKLLPLVRQALAEAGLSVARPRRRGLHRRSGPGRGPDGGRRGRPRPGLGAGRAGDRRPPHGRPPAGAAARAGSAGAAVRGPAGVRRPYPAGRGGRGRPLPAARAKRWTTPPARPSTRPPS